MSINLIPCNEDLGTHEVPTGAWNHFLVDGLGLPCGFGPSIRPGYVVHPGDYSLNTNDGAAVSNAEAVAMSIVARGLAFVYREQRRVYNNEVDKSLCEKQPRPVHYPQLLEDFAQWAGRSGGFKVH